jgi:hypothetical protein
VLASVTWLCVFFVGGSCWLWLFLGGGGGGGGGDFAVQGHPAELSMPRPHGAVGLEGPVVTFLNATPSFMGQAMRFALGRELYCCCCHGW